jgi:peptidyl-prolyl cis-trans isomerase B (cyclophilin B)
MRAAVVALLLLLAAAGCGGDGGSGAPDAVGCEEVETPAAREPETLEPPAGTLDPTRTWSLVFDTSCGEFTVELDLTLAPETSASLVSLAQEGYYDDTIFHRIVPGVVIQGGDATQSGGGSPGYATLDRPPFSVRYTKGVVAMAKTELAAAGTAGSQFFVVTAEDAGLDPAYAVVGRVSDGLDVVERIGRLGDPETQRPTRTVLVRGVTVDESS